MMCNGIHIPNNDTVCIHKVHCIIYVYTHVCIYIYIYIVQIWHPIEYHRNTIHPSIVALHYLSLVPVSLCVILLHCSDTGLT